MKLLNEARSAEVLIKEHYGDPLLLPIVNVRKVALSNRHSLDSEADEENEMPTIPIPKLPKPAFGSNLNLVGLGGSGSPSNILRNAVRLGSPALTPTGRNTPPALCRNTPPSRFSSPANSRIRSSISLSEMEENSCDSPKFYPNISYGWEITVASVDSPGLLKFLTSALSSASLDMNIRVGGFCKSPFFWIIDLLRFHVFRKLMRSVQQMEWLWRSLWEKGGLEVM